MSNEEREQILNMLDGGKITAQQALDLIAELQAEEYAEPFFEEIMYVS